MNVNKLAKLTLDKNSISCYNFSMDTRESTIYRIDSTCLGGGYTYCRTSPPHPKANAKGLYPLHRVMMENRLGRSLHDDEIVHHLDNDRYNNSIDNLAVMSNAEHTSLHAKTVSVINRICPVCGSEFSLKPSKLRDRIRQSKSGKITCSRKCGGKIAWISSLEAKHLSHKQKNAGSSPAWSTGRRDRPKMSPTPDGGEVSNIRHRANVV